MKGLYAVLVGCDYRGDDRPETEPLVAAEADAKRLAALLLAGPLPGGELRNLRLMVGATATTAGIQDAIASAVHEAADETDTVLLFFSGHGRRGENGLVLYTWDGTYDGRSLLDDLTGGPAQKRAVLDCCHAAAIGQEA